MLLRRSVRQQAGYTLIELLVVISIIAVLMSLTTAAVMKFLNLGPKAKTTQRISALSSAISKFNGEQNKIGYIPAGQVDMNQTVPATGASNPNFQKVIGPFRLRNTYPPAPSPANPDRNALDTNCFEAQYITKLFPSADLNNLGLGTNFAADLNANQTVVFFLCGVQVIDAAGNVRFDGFSNNPKQPFAPKGTANDTRKPPYLDMNAGLYVLAPTMPNKVQFAQIVDGFGNPLAYFSAHNNKPGKMSGSNAIGGVPYPGNPVPYGANGRFENDTGFQLISAGKDGTFGANGNWAAVDANGKDDQSNFSDRVLGAGPN